MNKFIIVQRLGSGLIAVDTDSIIYIEDVVINDNKETHIHLKPNNSVKWIVSATPVSEIYDLIYVK